MPDRWSTVARLVMRRLPPETAERAFLPAWHDARRRHALGCRRARSHWSRACLHLRLGLALATLAVQSGRLAADNRRASRRLDLHPNPPGRGVDPMLLQDLRFAVRMLWKKPGFTLTAIAVLAITIGANNAIFSIVQQVLLRPLPFGQPERIVRIHETNPRGPVTVSPANFMDWQAQNRTLEFMAIFDDARMTLSGGAAPERIRAAIVGAALFDVLGVQPQLGRTFSAEEAQAGGPDAVILSHGLWQRRFGGDRGVLGTTLTIDARNHVVVGVMPRDLTFPDGFELWLPLVLTPAQLRDSQRGAHYVDAVGRLKPGVSIVEAQSDLAAIERRIAGAHPNVQGYGIWLQPVFDSVVGEYRRPLWMLFGAVTCVLLIGCANISNLLLSRAAARRGEIGIRTALGAGRWRIVRQLLAESTILSIVGGCAGLLLAVWASRVMNTLLPADIPRAEGIGLNAPVLIFTTTVSIVTGLLFGIVPALEASRANLVDSLKDVRRDGSGGARQRMRSTLVAVEVALALVLLAGAGLALRSFDRLTRVDPGFEPAGTLAVDLVLPEATYPDAGAVVRFYRNYLAALAMQPGVAAAGAISTPPLARSSFGGTFTLVGRPEPTDEPRTAVRAATPGYLEAVRIPLRRGRLITAADTETAPHVAVISEAAARRYWPGEDPLGQRIRLHVSTYAEEGEREIVGVVADVKAGRIESAAAPLVYVPHAQYPFEFMTIMVRSTGEPMTLAPMVRAQLGSLDPNLAIGAIRPGTALLDDAVAQPRFRMRLLTLFAAAALALAVLGLYAVMSFSVSQRRSEIGLRIALGAGRGEVIALVLQQGMLPVALGLAAGLAGAAAMTNVMRGLLFGIEPLDPMTFAAVSLLLAAVAVMACYVPARRAASVDPLVALRSQ